MLEQYIDAVISQAEADTEADPEKEKEEGESDKTEEEGKVKGEGEKGEEEGHKSPEPEDEQDESLQAAERDGEKVEEESEKNEFKEEKEEDVALMPEIDLREALDTLIGELPESQAMTESLSPSWTIKVFCKAHELHCNCRDKLYHLVAGIFPRLLPEDLAILPPDLLCEIVQEASAGDTAAFRPELVSATIDQYLLELADKKKLTVDVFSKLVKAVPTETRENHDALFQVLEKLLNSGKLILI